jgi:phytoene synthase
MSIALERSYAEAEKVTATWARSFHFASRFLPAGKKRAIFALYDYCRYADNLVDLRGERPADDVRADLEALDGMVRRLHDGEIPEDTRWLALHDTMANFDIPLAPLTDLLVGVGMDLDPVEFDNFATLERYSRYVAGGVGLMLGPVLGAPSDSFTEPGVGLGIAMQLTNVLRDVGEDLDRGRVYLPRDELARFGLDRAALERRTVTPAFRELMRFQIARAREYYHHADQVWPLFPSDGSRLAVRLMQHAYATILDMIERNDYDVFTRRAFTSAPRKLAILAQTIWDEHRPGGSSSSPG